MANTSLFLLTNSRSSLKPSWDRTALPEKNAIAFAVTFMLSTSSLAQSASEVAQPQTLKNVVITATRSAIDSADAPAAVTVVTSDEIEQKNLSRITDALTAVPSLYMSRGESGQSSSSEGAFSLRGMSTNRTLVLMDGTQPLQNANSQGVNWLTVFVDDVERVEVVPGAFGALYGSNAMGGVVNIISKRADQNELTVRLKRGFDDAAGNDASLYFRRKLANGLGINAGLSQADREGFAGEYVVRPLTPGAGGAPVNGAIPTSTREGAAAYTVGDRGKQPWKQKHALVRLSYDLNATDRVYGGVARAEASQGFSRFNSYLTNAATGAPVSSGTLLSNGDRFTLSESNFLGATPSIDNSTRYFAGYEGLVSPNVKLKFDVARIDRQYHVPTSGSTTATTWNGGPGSLTDAPNSGTDATASLSFPAGDRHFLVAGASVHHDTVERRSYSLRNWRDPESRTALNNGYNGDSTTTSIFAQDEITLSDQLTVYAGGRFDHWKTKGSYFQNTAPVTAAAYPSRSDSAFNPKLSAVYKPIDSVTLRSSWGQSFRSPSNLDLYSTTVSNSTSSPTGRLTVQSDPKLKPERGTSWEVGGEWRVNPLFSTSATYYRTRLKDMIYSRQIDPSLTQRINAGAAEVCGLELGVTARLAPWLEMHSNVSFMNSEMLSNTADPTSVGKKLVQVPARLAYVGFTAKHGHWSGTLEARYTDHAFILAANRDVVEGVQGSYDAHTLVNTKFGYQLNKTVRLNLALNNLLDSKAFTFSQLPGRNVTAEAVMSF